MKKKKLSNQQTTMLSSQTKKQKENVEYLREQYKIAVASFQLARQLSEDAGLWGHHLERYGSGKLSPDSWWLHTDLNLSEEYPDAPNLNDYGTGSYREHDPKIDEFVMARAKWILPQLEQELKEVGFEK
ncbi:unnamed protein product, partial [marine sediment metagenome]